MSPGIRRFTYDYILDSRHTGQSTTILVSQLPPHIRGAASTRECLTEPSLSEHVIRSFGGSRRQADRMP